MKPVMRYQSQLLFRKSYKPNRVIRIRPNGKRNLLFRPGGAESNRVMKVPGVLTPPDITFSD